MSDVPQQPVIYRQTVYSPVLFFLAVWLLLMIGGRESFFRDPGTFWHVRTGEWILDHHAFLDHDPYTFTFHGQPWTPYEWLGEVGMAAIDRLAATSGLLTVSTAVLSLAFTMLFLRILRTGLHWLPAAGLVLLAVAAASSHFHARPHVLTILFLLLTYLQLVDYEAGRIRFRGLIVLIVLFVVWVNSHGGVLGGFGTVGLAVGGWLAFAVVRWPSPIRSRSDAIGLCGWLVAIGLTALATPYGLGLPRTWLDIMGMSELPSIIQEHMPVNPAEPSSWPFFALGGVYLFLLAGLREKPRVTWLLPLVWLVLGCERVRHAPLFAVTAVAAIAEFFPYTIWARRLASRPDFYQPPQVKPCTTKFGIALCGLVIFTALLLQTLGVRVPVVGAGWARFPEAEWPLALIPALKQSASGQQDVPIFNEYEFGGFLIYFTPEYRPFVDDRCEVFGGPWLAEFVAAGAGDATQTMRKWETMYPRFDRALTRPGSGFDRYFAAHPEEWTEVQATPAGRLWRRVHPHTRTQ